MDSDRKISRHRGFLSRLRHYRGHGIHSPFVYSLVRSVFTGSGEADGELYCALKNNGLAAKTSRRIERLHTFCGFGGFSLGYAQGAEICIILPADDFRPDMVCGSPGTVFVIVEPYGFKQKNKNCLTIASKFSRLTIDSYEFFIIFDMAREPKQHFKI